MSERMERAEHLTGYRYEDDSDFLRALRVAHAGGENLVKSVFGRVQVAVIGENRRIMLGAILGRALDYALEQLTRREGFGDDFWSRRAAVYAEIVSRLSVRLSSTEDPYAIPTGTVVRERPSLEGQRTTRVPGTSAGTLAFSDSPICQSGVN